MTEDELRRAIDRPARLAALEPEPGLVEIPGGLHPRPYRRVAACFSSPFKKSGRRREDYRLTIRTYREIGQIEARCSEKPTRFMRPSRTTRRSFAVESSCGLVQPGEGSEDTRRRASLRELLPDDPMQARAVRAIINRLADPESRLLTTGRQQTGSGEGTPGSRRRAPDRRLAAVAEVDRDRPRRPATHLRPTDAAKEWADAATEAKETTSTTEPAWLSRANGRHRTATS